MIADHGQNGRVAKDALQGVEGARDRVGIVRECGAPDGVIDDVAGEVDVVDFLRREFGFRITEVLLSHNIYLVISLDLLEHVYRRIPR